MARILMVWWRVKPLRSQKPKTGGLAAVVGALPRTLAELGHEVAVVMPRYGNIATTGLTHAWGNLIAYLGRHAISADIWTKQERGVTFFFVDTPWLYDRFGYYGHADDHLRFGNLCLNALNVIRFLWRPDVVHLHDWQSALVAPYLKTRFQMDRPSRASASSTRFTTPSIWAASLPRCSATSAGRPRGWTRCVSARHEIQTAEFSFGLDAFLQSHSPSLVRGASGGPQSLAGPMDASRPSEC